MEVQEVQWVVRVEPNLHFKIAKGSKEMTGRPGRLGNVVVATRGTLTLEIRSVQGHGAGPAALGGQSAGLHLPLGLVTKSFPFVLLNISKDQYKKCVFIFYKRTIVSCS